MARQYGVPEDPQQTKGRGRYRPGVAGGSQGAQPYGQQNRSAQEPRTRKEDPSPTSSVVAQFHKNADTDARAESAHHTLGSTATQASPGDHTHDGSTSRKILDGMTLTGTKTNPATMWPSIINALVRLGAEDNTT